MKTQDTPPEAKSVKVVLVDDSPIVLNILKRIFSVDSTIEVVATAQDGREALRLIKELRPDVVCTDLHMPLMDGYELTERIMAECPLPILVISVSVQDHQDENIFRLLGAGAVDVFAKPRAGFKADSREAQALRHRVKLLAGVTVIRRGKIHPMPQVKQESRPVKVSQTPRIVAMGASTGGPQAILEIIAGLPGNFPLPILCVQHISPGFLDSLLEWLDESTGLTVKMAEKNEHPLPGHVYFPPEGVHLVVDSHGRLDLSQAEPVNGQRPSVDTLFESLAHYYGRLGVAVLLSGMGNDGAAGMAAVALSGGLTIAQDEATSVVFGMPKEAVELGAVKHLLPLAKIAPTLNQLVDQETS